MKTANILIFVLPFPPFDLCILLVVVRTNHLKQFIHGVVQTVSSSWTLSATGYWLLTDKNFIKIDNLM